MRHICVIDDDEAVRDSLTAFLEASGYAVTNHSSAVAMLAAGAELTECHCMLVDVHMPGMSGLELAESLRRRGIDTPIILITAATDAKLRASAEKLDGLTFLDKPIDGDALLETIARLSKGFGASWQA